MNNKCTHAFAAFQALCGGRREQNAEMKQEVANAHSHDELRAFRNNVFERQVLKSSVRLF